MVACRAMQRAFQEALYIARRKAEAICMVNLDCTVQEEGSVFLIVGRWTDSVVAMVEATVEYKDGYRPSYNIYKGE